MEKKVGKSEEYTKPELVTHEPLRDITADASVIETEPPETGVPS